MDNDIYNLIKEVIDGGKMSKIAISAPFGNVIYKKIIVEPKMGKELYYQFSMFYGNKVKHVNLSRAEAALKLMEILETGYKQCDINCDESIKILMNKKGAHKIIRNSSENKNINLTHDKGKNYILNEGENIPWLVHLGVMTENGRVVSSYYKKFKQINKFLEMIRDVSVPHGANILDFGCGKSYLTFAMYYFLNCIENKNVTITGLDLKQDVVNNCNELAKQFGFENLSFITGDIANYSSGRAIDMTVMLHACDTATDYALYKAVISESKIIMSAPCCQHELFSQIKSESLKPLLRHGIIKERFSTLLTDSLRAVLLEASGYKCDVIEFIDMEHTPKNIMLRAIKSDKSEKSKVRALKEYFALSAQFRVTPTLYTLLKSRFECDSALRFQKNAESEELLAFEEQEYER